MSDKAISFGIITCSDTRDVNEDEAGCALEGFIKDEGWTVLEHVVVKDEISSISDAIVHCCDELKCDVVLTCGGTGLSLRDVTPEATRAVCERDVPGIAEAMRAHSLSYTSNAMLSRAVCMQRNSTLVVNLPGSTKAATQNWECLVGVIAHAVLMTAGAHH